MLKLRVDGHIYDVTKYAPNHPGEGIRNVYLRHYAKISKQGKIRDRTDEMDRYHLTNQPWELLEAARNLGIGKLTDKGIIYLGPE